MQLSFPDADSHMQDISGYMNRFHYHHQSTSKHDSFITKDDNTDKTDQLPQMLVC